MNLYLDSSALIKRYLVEDGREEVVAAMTSAESCSACRIGFVETVRAVVRARGDAALERVRGDWQALDIVDVDQVLVERAAELAIESGLRSLDALHLAAALSLAEGDALTFATWDARLHRAARAHGLRTLPATLG